MNPDPQQPQPSSSGLQFDKAEFHDSTPLQCAVCKAPITAEFYQINGQAVCPSCRNQAATEVGSPAASRLGIAIAAGLAAAVAGVCLYWIVAILAGRPWNIVALAVGWVVGYAVRWGSRGRGGLPYQAIAVGMTYLSISAWHARYFLPTDLGNVTASDFVTAFGNGFMYPWTRGTSAIFLWVLIAFGLHQAWSMNRGVQLQITGPFSARQSSPPAST
jgi:hypothetical protein